MQKIIVKNEHIGKRIDKIIISTYKHLAKGALHKAFRKKDIKVNGKWVKEDFIPSLNDEIEVYISDNILFNIKASEPYTVEYEDDDFLIVFKEQGVPVHPDKEQTQCSLIQLLEKNHPKIDLSLCHRLDRNTAGFVILAKNKKALELMLKAFENSNIQKYYKCAVLGNPPQSEGLLTHYLKKNSRLGKVYISDTPQSGYLDCALKYKLLKSETKNFYQHLINYSILEIQLLTGRTHQIRAQLSHIGNPILGDNKYGNHKLNKNLGLKFQELVAYKLQFHFDSKSELSYLNNLTLIKDFKSRFLTF